MYAKILLMTAVLLSGQVYAQSTTADPSTDTIDTNATPPVIKKDKKKKKKVAEAAAVTAPVAEVKKEEPKKINPPVVVVAPATLPQKVWTYIKEKFSASYHGEYYFVRRDVESPIEADHKIQDIKYMHNPTVTYKASNNWVVMGTGEFKYTDAPKPGSATFVNNYYRALFTVTRKNILVEKERGIQLDAGAGRRDFNTKDEPFLKVGNWRIFTTITKNYGKSNGSLFLQYLRNDPKTWADTTWEHGLEVIPTINLQLTEKLTYLFNDDININTPKSKTTQRNSSITHEMNLAYLNYQWTEKINTYYQYKYYHTEDFTNAPKDDYMEHYAGIGYAFTPKITATGEIGSELFHAHDGRTFFAKKAHFPEFALYLDASL